MELYYSFKFFFYYNVYVLLHVQGISINISETMKIAQHKAAETQVMADRYLVVVYP